MRMLTIRVSIVAAALALLAAGYGLTSAGSHNDVDGDFVAAKLKPVPPAPFPCARFAPGSIVQNPPDLYSAKGKLVVDLSYQTISSQWGPLFCFMTPAGLENPTFHVQPGDQLIINLTNNTPKSADTLLLDPPHCGASEVTQSSVNMHFHGLHVSPACHQDDVVRTMVSSGQTFRYDVKFPTDEPPGLYWYHTHVHGLVDNALMGGASGAIVVEGIQNYFPQVAGLPEQILVVRDQPFPSSAPTPTAAAPTPTPVATPTFTPVPTCSGVPTPAPTPSPVCSGASNDLSLNFVDIGCPETPAVIQTQGAAPQLWRVVNASGDDIVDLQVVYNGEPQTLHVVAFDGVPVNSQDAATSAPPPEPVAVTDILLGSGNRAEFLITPPAPGTDARLVTLPVNDGSQGANFPERTLAVIQDLSFCPPPSGVRRTVPTEIGPRVKPRFGGLATAPSSATRKIYFSEDFPTNPPNLFDFYVTVDGATPKLFYYNDPPAIVTTQGAVEEWTIENRSEESHVFHIHQIHFLVESFNNFPPDFPNPNGIAYDQNQFLDSITVPYWDGVHAYPSVTLKLDFRPPVTGDFVYHCHLAFHEDNGMMAIVRVMPSKTAAIVEKARIYLASLGLLGGTDPVEKQRVEAWCYRGKTVWRKQEEQASAPISNRAFARRAGTPVSAN